jgi:hypothetical protein
LIKDGKIMAINGEDDVKVESYEAAVRNILSQAGKEEGIQLSNLPDYLGEAQWDDAPHQENPHESYGVLVVNEAIVIINY